MTKITKSIEIEVALEKVFAFVISDKMNDVWREWMDGKWDSEPVKVGTIGHYDAKGDMSIFGKLKSEVTELEKNKRMTRHTTATLKAKWVDTTDSIVLEPAAKGTKVTNFTEYKVPYSILGKLAGAISNQQKQIETMRVKMLENLKKALEA